MVTGKFTDVFRGIFMVWEKELSWGGGMWEDISMEKLLMGEETFNEVGAGFFSII